jgi:hypothetical protein
MQSDSDYAESQYTAKQRWSENNQDYWKNYRKNNTAYTDRNRELQKKRDQKRRQERAKKDASDPVVGKMDASDDVCKMNTGGYKTTDPNLAKMDTSEHLNSLITGIYRIHPKNCHLAKMDASKKFYILIPIGYDHLAKMDEIDIHIG